ncbi:MAG TPA: phosphoglycerate mutase family protein [Allosphingosinicella sp.]|nr:phosphoglycerate mutase family protein [Allosphingosinicella sp.]
MALFRPLAALLMLALAACETMPPPPTGPSFYVMRHLQKAEGADPPLSEEGRAGTRRLIGFFMPDPPRVIYVSTTRRARETAAPLAAELRVKMRRYDPADTPRLIARVLAERGPVLIVGHSNTVPEIVERLGGERPAALADTDYGDVWHVWGEPRRTVRLSIGP